ncbi:MAG TPA: hypothetical protein V6D12_22605 [Candidatus Obscuribacterales bacterium]
MTESKKASAKKQIEFAVRYQPEAGTPDAVLLEYIRDSRIIPSREMVFQALRAFWLPFAYRASGEVSSEEELQLALEAVYALDKHADYICAYFGLERPGFVDKSPRPIAKGSNGKVIERKHMAVSTPAPATVHDVEELEEEEYEPADSFPDDD